jgi:hypothetical protein
MGRLPRFDQGSANARCRRFLAIPECGHEWRLPKSTPDVQSDTPVFLTGFAFGLIASVAQLAVWLEVYLWAFPRARTLPPDQIVHFR